MKNEHGKPINKPLPTRVSESFFKRVDEFAEERGESRSEVVRQAVKVGMDVLEEEEDPRERIEDLEEENQHLRERVEDLRNLSGWQKTWRTATLFAYVAVLGVLVFLLAVIFGLPPQLELAGNMALIMMLFGGLGFVMWTLGALARWAYEADNPKETVLSKFGGLRIL